MRTEHGAGIFNDLKMTGDRQSLPPRMADFSLPQPTSAGRGIPRTPANVRAPQDTRGRWVLNFRHFALHLSEAHGTQGERAVVPMLEVKLRASLLPGSLSGPEPLPFTHFV